jgi:hypothetical protein
MKEFWDWVSKTFTVDYRKEIEEYLADSVNHADLEHRIQTLIRRGMI